MALIILGREGTPCDPLSLAFMKAQQFLMGLGLGEFHGQSITVNSPSSSLSLDITTLLLWQGAPSWRNHLLRQILMNRRRWCSSTVLYCSLFMVWLLGKRPLPPSTAKAAPDHDRGRVFNHGNGVLLEAVLGLLTVASLELTSRKVNSSENITCSQSLSFRLS